MRQDVLPRGGRRCGGVQRCAAATRALCRAKQVRLECKEHNPLRDGDRRRRDGEPTPAWRTTELEATRTIVERVERRFELKPERLNGDVAYGTPTWGNDSVRSPGPFTVRRPDGRSLATCRRSWSIGQHRQPAQSGAMARSRAVVREFSVGPAAFGHRNTAKRYTQEQWHAVTSGMRRKVRVAP